MSSTWNKISLYKFQQIDIINAKDISEIDKTLFSICAIYDFTEYELDSMPLSQVNKLTEKATKIFSSEFTPKVYNRIGRYFINYDPSKLTLGQYIELSYFLSDGPLKNAHYVMASLSHKAFRKNKTEEHRRKADYFLKAPITQIMGGLSLIIERFTAFNNEYKSLFGLDKEVTGDVQEDKFNKRYGWIYSTEQIALYERISLKEAYKLPVRQAFNDLAYLKAKMAYESEQLKSN